MILLLNKKHRAKRAIMAKKGKRNGKRKAFGGYSIHFVGRNETIESVFGKTPIPPSLMTKKLWKFVKSKSLGHK
jgi:hypothetical protein